jgi:tRNA(fMet)-specific endonuclease VapC
MGQVLNVDTYFLIDLEREQRRKLAGSAEALLRNHVDTVFFLSVTAFGEFAAGFDRPDHPRLETIRKGYQIVVIDDKTSEIYAKLYSQLKAKKCLIGANDLWIAASALQHGGELVTRNVDEFSRVPGLKVMRY